MARRDRRIEHQSSFLRRMVPMALATRVARGDPRGPRDPSGGATPVAPGQSRYAFDAAAPSVNFPRPLRKPGRYKRVGAGWYSPPSRRHGTWRDSNRPGRAFRPGALPPWARSRNLRRPQPSLSCREHVPGAQPPVTEGHVIIIGGRGGQGPRPRHPEPLRRPRRRPRRDHRRHLDRVVAGLEAGERYKQVFGELGVNKVRHDPRRDPRPGQRRDRGPRHPRRDRRVHDRRQPAAAVVDDRRHAPRRRDPGASSGRAPSSPARAPGASAMSSHMIAFGASGATPKQRMAQIAAGLGVLPGRHRRPALPAAEPARPAARLIAQNPSLLGLGVDEDTAGVVGPDHVMEVIGRGSHHRRRRRRSPRPTPGRSTATAR